MIAYAGLADLFEHGGAVVAGGSALGSVGGLIAGAVLRELGRRWPDARVQRWILIAPRSWAERGGLAGGLLGFAVLAANVLG